MLFRGWQLFSILCQSFPPSKMLENYVKCYIQANFEVEAQQVDIISHYCWKMVIRTEKAGPRGKTFTNAELDGIMV